MNKKVYILTNDNYYFIVTKKYLRENIYFQNMFNKDGTVGSIKNPIFLQNICSKYFKCIIQYLKLYNNCKINNSFYKNTFRRFNEQEYIELLNTITDLKFYVLYDKLKLFDDI